MRHALSSSAGGGGSGRRWSWLVRALIVMAIAATTTGCGADDSAADPVSPIVVIVMENHEYGELAGNPQAPYINRLLRMGAVATRSYGVAHPSLPNYLALLGGSTFGIRDDCVHCHVPGISLVDQLEARGISWKAYIEALPAPCYRSVSAEHGRYAKRHNPFAYFDRIANDPRRCHKVVSTRQLDVDLRARRLPEFAWLTPDLCHDMHDCSVAAGDRYLAGIVPRLLGALGSHGLLVLTWDEGTSSQGCCRLARGGRIVTVLAGPAARNGVRSTRAYDHYSLLHTIEALRGLHALRAAGCDCSPVMSDLVRIG